ncbi:MAG: PTS sugar transporter subunit IIA [Deltaproteobacteria bacterium]|nr:PTS sugar transporter subunit IIA [Deltaproteobacteria bacterium]
MPMANDRADDFLRMIRRSRRGRLKVYLGYAAGVGKTWQMLQEGHRLQKDGIDVVIGLLETHGRADTAGLAGGIEVVPRRSQLYRGIALEEMDVDAVLRRNPQVALVDELAHTNIPGSRNAKRYEDVQDLLAAGIHVITTMNVQHLESLYDTVERAAGVKVRERLPDNVLAEADQIVNVDLTPEDLQVRLREGKVYPAERIGTALSNFFQASHLENLRELTLREMAAQIDQHRHETPEEAGGVTPDQVLVCLSSQGPNSEKLLRYASRLAGKLNRNWYAIYVQTPAEEATVIDSRTQRLLSGTLTLAKELGAMVFTYKGEDIVATILRFVHEYRVGHIVLGSPAPIPFWKRIIGRRSIPERLIAESRGMTIVVLDTRHYEPSTFQQTPAETVQIPPAIEKASPPPQTRQLTLSSMLDASKIVIWIEPVDKEKVLAALVWTVTTDAGLRDEALRAIRKREAEGSTFFNEGVSFPHARIVGLENPLVSLGLTRGGVPDAAVEKPVEYVFLSLSPFEKPEIQVQLLALAARALQNRLLSRSLQSAADAREVYAALRTWEESSPTGRESPPDSHDRIIDTGQTI